MKMRVRENSIRLRLTQSEVKRFGEIGLVEETLEFGDAAKLTYALESESGAEKVEVRFQNQRIAVIVPQNTAKHWTDSNEVGIKTEQNIRDGKTLRILIEKDFACLETRTGEDEFDAFPNPSENKIC